MNSIGIFCSPDSYNIKKEPPLDQKEKQQTDRKKALEARLYQVSLELNGDITKVKKLLTGLSQREINKRYLKGRIYGQKVNLIHASVIMLTNNFQHMNQERVQKAKNYLTTLMEFGCNPLDKGLGSPKNTLLELEDYFDNHSTLKYYDSYRALLEIRSQIKTASITCVAAEYLNHLFPSPLIQIFREYLIGGDLEIEEFPYE